MDRFNFATPQSVSALRNQFIERNNRGFQLPFILIDKLSASIYFAVAAIVGVGVATSFTVGSRPAGDGCIGWLAIGDSGKELLAATPHTN